MFLLCDHKILLYVRASGFPFNHTTLCSTKGLEMCHVTGTMYIARTLSLRHCVTASLRRCITASLRHCVADASTPPSQRLVFRLTGGSGEALAR